MTEDPRDTRHKLLEAATELFAESGFDGTSIRDIAAAAGVNVAAVNYHFQGKEKLFYEVLRTVVESKRDRYMEAMGQIMDQGPGDLETLIRSFYRLHFEDTLMTPEGNHFLKLFVREMHHGQRETTRLIKSLLFPMWEDLGAKLLRSCPEVTPEIAPWVTGSLHGQMVHFTMRWRGTCGGGDSGQEEDHPLAEIFPPLCDNVDDYIEAAVEHITRFSVAGIRACIEAQSELTHDQQREDSP